MNVTDTSPIFDLEKTIDDWKHLRNLPSLKSVIVFFAGAVHFGIDLIVSSMSFPQSGRATAPRKLVLATYQEFILGHGLMHR